MSSTLQHPSVEAPAWTVRPERPIDLDAIYDLHRSAFSGLAEAELVDAIRSGPDFIPELSLVAVTEDGSVIGHALVSRVGFQPDAADTARIDVLALAPMAVLPPHQGRGIGTALVREALAEADGRDEPFVVVLGSPPFYSRFGSVPADAFEVRGPYQAAGEAFQLRPRAADGNVIAGLVVYPTAFGEV